MKPEAFDKIATQFDIDGDEPLLQSWEINLKWRNAWLRVVARAWEDAAFRQKVLDDKTTLAAFADVGFDAPTFFRHLVKIKVIPGSGDYNPPVGSQRMANGWPAGEGLQTELVLRLPPAPKKPEQFARALADFDAGGHVYAQTIC